MIASFIPSCLRYPHGTLHADTHPVIWHAQIKQSSAKPPAILEDQRQTAGKTGEFQNREAHGKYSIISLMRITAAPDGNRAPSGGQPPGPLLPQQRPLRFVKNRRSPGRGGHALSAPRIMTGDARRSMRAVSVGTGQPDFSGRRSRIAISRTTSPASSRSMGPWRSRKPKSSSLLGRFDPQDMHTDPEKAARGPFGGLKAGHVRRVVKWLALGLAAWIGFSLVLFLVSAQVQSAKVSDAADSELGGAGYPLTSPNTILVLGSDHAPRTPKSPAPRRSASRAARTASCCCGSAAATTRP